MVEGSQFLELIAPNVDFLHDILVLTDLPDFSQDGGILILVELFSGAIIPGENV